MFVNSYVIECRKLKITEIIINIAQDPNIAQHADFCSVKTELDSRPGFTPVDRSDRLAAAMWIV